MMKLKKILLFALALMCLVSAVDAQEAARQLAHRLLGDRADYFEFDIKKATAFVVAYDENDKAVEVEIILPQADYFRLIQQGNHLLIEGNNENSLAMGLNHYLRHYALVHVSWFDCHPVEMPASWPKLDSMVHCASIVPDRFFLNYCTYGYTMAWWQWPQWERFIDWMALNGINMPLALTGQESVWQEVWREYGLTDDEIRSYFSGPAHLPWHRMANLDGFGGPLPQQWIDSQKELQMRILQRERELGMTPVLPAFAGHVPRQIAERFPNADIKQLSSWCGFEPTYFMNPTDPLFADIQRRYLLKQQALFGTNHIYGCDPFNEMDPPSWEPDYLANVSRHIYSSMQAVDPEAQWLQMSWVFYYKRAQWTPERLRAYLTAVPQDSMLLLDYFCEKTEVWRTTIDSSMSTLWVVDNELKYKQSGFYGQPFIWCYLGNFGGNTMLVGDIPALDQKLNDALCEVDYMRGIGSTLEGFDCSPQIFEYLFESVWNTLAGRRLAPTAKHFSSDDWADLRYGAPNEYARQAWQLLTDSVYKDWSFYGLGSQVCARPSFEGHGTYYTKPYYSYDNEALLRAIRLLMKHPSVRQSYHYDLVNLLSQYLANRFMEVRNAFTIAYKEKNVKLMEQTYEVAKNLMADLNNLLLLEPSANFDRWLSQARAWGGDDVSLQDYYETQARTLVTIWGGPVLNDYGNRLWGGLVKKYYWEERWNHFFEAAIEKVRKGESLDEKDFGERQRFFEERFAQRTFTKSFGLPQEQSVVKVANRILKNIDKGLYNVPDHDLEQFQSYMNRYPEASLQDVYKWCFQDVYGPGHIIKDSASCAQYLQNELASMSPSAHQWYFEYCGPNGNFVRVNLDLINRHLITVDQLVSALMRSAEQTQKMPLYDWTGIWQRYQQKLSTMTPRPKDFEQNAEQLAQHLASGQYVFHHSDNFNKVYDMHYRIIRRDIFEQEILPLLPANGKK